MKKRWWILWAAGLWVVAVWGAVVVAHVWFKPTLAVWTAMVTVGAFSLEGFFWVAAGVAGWSFLEGRRQTLLRLRKRLFGR